MNLQQLEYIIALDNFRHFEKAAESCYVTQATLSVMIKKLEQELGVVLFDRSKQPVLPTEAGREVIEQARVVVREAAQLRQIAQQSQTATHGELRIGIIPTVAPYLLPLFLAGFLKKYPDVKLKVLEQTTENLLQQLAAEKLDVAIMATPEGVSGYAMRPLYHEEFKVYVSDGEKSLKKKYVLPEDIDVNRLWLLEEGHCLRSQVLNLCEIQKTQAVAHRLDYETGSIESLLKITELNGGITIIPQLATIDFDAQRQKNLRHFKPPVPVREISLVTYRHFIKKKLLEILEKEIVSSVAGKLKRHTSEQVIALEMN